jgi:ABC-type transport system involved in multi-copper enzyme maturation permease subunit
VVTGSVRNVQGSASFTAELQRLSYEFGMQNLAFSQLLAMAAILLVTPILIAGTIIDEREKGSLELLLTTDLSNREIIWGKLGPRLLLMLTLVLSVVPMLAITQFVGGVDPRVLAACSIANVATLMAVAGVSIYCSVRQRTLRAAMGWMVLILLALFSVRPALGLTFSVLFSSGSARAPAWDELCGLMRDAASAFHPYWFLTEITDMLVRGAPKSHAAILLTVLFVGVQLLIGYSCLLLASAQLRTAQQRQLLEQVQAAKRLRGNPRPPIWADYPLAWKEITDPVGLRLRWWGWGLVILAASLWFGPPLFKIVYYWSTGDLAGAFRYLEQPWLRINSDQSNALAAIRIVFQSAAQIFLFLFGFMLLIVTLRAAASIVKEKDRKTWDDLVSSPVSLRDVLLAKLLGSLCAVRSMFIVAIVLVAMQLMFISWYSALVILISVVANLILLAQLGLFQSIHATSTMRAWVGAVIVGGLLVGAPLFAAALLPRYSSSGGLVGFVATIANVLSHTWLLGVAATVIVVAAKFSPRPLQRLLLSLLIWAAITLPLLILIMVMVCVFAWGVGINASLEDLVGSLSPLSVVRLIDLAPYGAYRVVPFQSILLFVALFYLGIASFVLGPVNFWRLARTCGRIDGQRPGKVRPHNNGMPSALAPQRPR